LASADEIPPGGEGKIDVHVSTGRSTRQIRQIVRVITNDPQNPKARLIVTVAVQADLEVVPNLLKFDAEQPNAAQVTLKNTTNAPVQLSEIISSNEHVKVSISSMTIPANGEVVLIGELLPNVPVGILKGWIKMKSNLKSMPIVEIRVWGNIQK